MTPLMWIGLVKELDILVLTQDLCCSEAQMLSVRFVRYGAVLHEHLVLL